MEKVFEIPLHSYRKSTQETDMKLLKILARATCCAWLSLITLAAYAAEYPPRRRAVGW